MSDEDKVGPEVQRNETSESSTATSVSSVLVPPVHALTSSVPNRDPVWRVTALSGFANDTVLTTPPRSLVRCPELAWKASAAAPTPPWMKLPRTTRLPLTSFPAVLPPPKSAVPFTFSVTVPKVKLFISRAPEARVRRPPDTVMVVPESTRNKPLARTTRSPLIVIGASAGRAVPSITRCLIAAVVGRMVGTPAVPLVVSITVVSTAYVGGSCAILLRMRTENPAPRAPERSTPAPVVSRSVPTVSEVPDPPARPCGEKPLRAKSVSATTTLVSNVSMDRLPEYSRLKRDVPADVPGVANEIRLTAGPPMNVRCVPDAWKVAPVDVANCVKSPASPSEPAVNVDAPPSKIVAPVTITESVAAIILKMPPLRVCSPPMTIGEVVPGVTMEPTPSTINVSVAVIAPRKLVVPPVVEMRTYFSPSVAA